MLFSKSSVNWLTRRLTWRIRTKQKKKLKRWLQFFQYCLVTLIFTEAFYTFTNTRSVYPKKHLFIDAHAGLPDGFAQRRKTNSIAGSTVFQRGHGILILEASFYTLTKEDVYFVENIWSLTHTPTYMTDSHKEKGRPKQCYPDIANATCSYIAAIMP